MNKPSKLKIENLITVEPLTEGQKTVFNSYKSGNNLCLSGSPGTGKTFVALYLALEEVLTRGNEYDKVIIIRSIVPTRDIGFLPGEIEDKEQAYAEPYQEICRELFDDQIAWKKLAGDHKIIFRSTSFLRGLTFKNAIVIIDEMQNCNYHELCTIATRLGDNCKFITCGDYYQSDLSKQGDKNGVLQFIKILENMNRFDHVQFTWADCVRSGFVRDFLQTKEMMERAKL